MIDRQSRIALGLWLAAAAVGFYALRLGAGCGKWKAIAGAYRTTIVVDREAREADPHVAAYLQREVARCIKAHGPKTAGYQACVKPAVDRAIAFRTAVKANVVAQDATRAAHLGVGKADPIVVGAAAACAFLSAAKALAPFIAQLQPVADRLGPIVGVTCGSAH